MRALRRAADGSLHAVDAARGTRIWRFQARGQGPRQRRGAGRGGRVRHPRQSHLPARPAERPRGDALGDHGPVTSTPAWSGEHFIVGHRGSQLAARRPGRAEPVWSQPYWGSWIESSAVFHGGTGYIGSGDLFLVSAFDPASGRNLWRSHVGGWVVQRPR
jgi:outer membrane protein assembly factor BamB